MRIDNFVRDYEVLYDATLLDFNNFHPPIARIRGLHGFVLYGRRTAGRK